MKLSLPVPPFAGTLAREASFLLIFSRNYEKHHNVAPFLVLSAPLRSEKRLGVQERSDQALELRRRWLLQNAKLSFLSNVASECLFRAPGLGSQDVFVSPCENVAGQFGFDSFRRQASKQSKQSTLLPCNVVDACHIRASSTSRRLR
eukprot:GHVU01122730.1.p1 GENE.GHVU01122730.1~~GHVU01122730.1.p1  ORF type:complete len:147 (-),score=1.83 GHVU01122730.1:21-461(-)